MANYKYSAQIKDEIIKDYHSIESGTSIAKKKNRFGIHLTVISLRSHSSGSLTTIHKGGRLRKTTTADDKWVIRLIKKNPYTSARSLANYLLLNVSLQAVEGRLNSYRSAKNNLFMPKIGKPKRNFN